jgi:hypothetical protein
MHVGPAIAAVPAARKILPTSILFRKVQTYQSNGSIALVQTQQGLPESQAIDRTTHHTLGRATAGTHPKAGRWACHATKASRSPDNRICGRCSARRAPAMRTHAVAQKPLEFSDFAGSLPCRRRRRRPRRTDGPRSYSTRPQETAPSLLCPDYRPLPHHNNPLEPRLGIVAPAAPIENRNLKSTPPIALSAAQSKT